IAVMQYSDKPEILTEWTSNKNIALSAVNYAKFGRRSMLLDALRFATAFLRKSSPDNKHLILITDGTDSAGRNLEVEAAFR
ncbi:VWA domain-containing protein, partial [Escherichia coli]|nr:VWA domain-containing protein [Escherichia coli]